VRGERAQGEVRVRSICVQARVIVALSRREYALCARAVAVDGGACALFNAMRLAAEEKAQHMRGCRVQCAA